jgi:hypothetical protein
MELTVMNPMIFQFNSMFDLTMKKMYCFRGWAQENAECRLGKDCVSLVQQIGLVRIWFTTILQFVVRASKF